MDAAIDALNSTGTWLLEKLEPRPGGVVICGFPELAVLVWVENLRAWLRGKREQRKERERQELASKTD